MKKSTAFAAASAALFLAGPAGAFPTAGEKSGYDAIMARLEPRGRYLEIVDAADFENDFRDLLKLVERYLPVALYADPSGAGDEEVGELVETIDRVFDTLVEQGVFAFRGRGSSVREEADGAFSRRSFLYAPGKSRFLDLFAAPDAEPPTDFIPDTAVVAVSAAPDIGAAWEIGLKVAAAVDPSLEAGFRRALHDVEDETGFDVSKAVESLKPGFFLAVTADPSKSIPVPGCFASLPGIGGVAGIKVSDATIPDFLFKAVRETFDGRWEPAAVEPAAVTRAFPGVKALSVTPPDDELAQFFRPVLAWDAKHGMLLFASTPEEMVRSLRAASGKGRLSDSAAFRKLAGSTGTKGGLLYLAPDVTRHAKRLLSSIKEDGIPPMVRDDVAALPDLWYVGRFTRETDGLLLKARSSWGSGSTLRMIGSGPGVIAAVGIVAGLAVPAVNNTMDSALAVRFANEGRNIVCAIVSENIDREASARPSIWPRKGAFETSNDYFASLLEKDCLRGLSFRDFGMGADHAFDLGTFRAAGCGWSCLAGIDSCDDRTPFLWSANLQVEPEDFAAGPDEDWSDRIDDYAPPFTDQFVLVVRKGGAMQILKKNVLTKSAFLGGSSNDPARLQVLEPYAYWDEDDLDDDDDDFEDDDDDDDDEGEESPPAFRELTRDGIN